MNHSNRYSYSSNVKKVKTHRQLHAGNQQLFDNLDAEKKMQSEIMQAMTHISAECCEKYQINMQRISGFNKKHTLWLDLTKIIIMEQKDAPIIINILAKYWINAQSNTWRFPDIKDFVWGDVWFYYASVDLSFFICDSKSLWILAMQDDRYIQIESMIIHELCHQKRGLFSATQFPTTWNKSLSTIFTRGGFCIRHYDHQNKTFSTVFWSFLEEWWVRYIQAMYIAEYRDDETKALLRQLAHSQISWDQYGFLYHYMYITARGNGEKTYLSDMNSLMWVWIDLLIQAKPKLYDSLLQSRDSDYQTSYSAHRDIIKILAGYKITKPDGNKSNLYRELMKLQYPSNNHKDAITWYKTICQVLGFSDPLRF